MTEERAAEESGNEEMNTERGGNEDYGLRSYSIEDPASDNGNRVSPQRNTIPTALTQASVIIGVDGGNINMAQTATSSPYDPSALGFSRLSLSKGRKRSASSVSDFTQTLDGGMGVDTDADSLVDKWIPVEMGILRDQGIAGGDGSPARKKSKN